jgi:hypothetical protein
MDHVVRGRPGHVSAYPDEFVCVCSVSPLGHQLRHTEYGKTCGALRSGRRPAPRQSWTITACADDPCSTSARPQDCPKDGEGAPQPPGSIATTRPCSRRRTIRRGQSGRRLGGSPGVASAVAGTTVVFDGRKEAACHSDGTRAPGGHVLERHVPVPKAVDQPRKGTTGTW